MNTVAFTVIAVFTLTFALVAATNPRLMHAALGFAAMFVGIAAFFFLLGAEFVGLVQIFVYVGAVAVLIVFTILLTRRDADKDRGFDWGGILVAVLVFSGLVWAILKTKFVYTAQVLKALSVKQIGLALMTHYVWPLQCVAVLLTVALIGALVLVMEDRPEQ